MALETQRVESVLGGELKSSLREITYFTTPEAQSKTIAFIACSRQESVSNHTDLYFVKYREIQCGAFMIDFATFHPTVAAVTCNKLCPKH